MAPETVQQVGSLETRTSNPSPAPHGLADPRANRFVWFPRLERKKIEEIKSDLPLRGWGGFCFAFCEEQLIKMIPNPSENKYRLYAFLEIIARTLVGIMAQFTMIKSLVNF